MTPFSKRVIELIQSIPAGKVATYGALAAAAGNPRAARQVARLLHSCSSSHNLPWHRVVNRSGELVLPNEAAQQQQRWLLQSEAVPFNAKGRVELFTCAWLPPSLSCIYPSVNE